GGRQPQPLGQLAAGPRSEPQQIPVDRTGALRAECAHRRGVRARLVVPLHAASISAPRCRRLVPRAPRASTAPARRWSGRPVSDMLPVTLPPVGAPSAGPRLPGGPMSETTAAAHDEQVTIYTAYEIDFMLGLRDTENGRITREQVGLRSAPESAEEFVTAAVTSGLRARGKVERSEDGQWLLGAEGQVIASALSAADRWLGLALADSEATRLAVATWATEATIVLTQDELGPVLVVAPGSPEPGPAAVAYVGLAFPEEGNQRTGSVPRRDSAAPTEPVSLMCHVEDD